VKYVSIPVRGGKNGRRKRTERSRWFRRLQRWRAAGEAKISLLKRKYWGRKTRVRGDCSQRNRYRLGRHRSKHRLALAPVCRPGRAGALIEAASAALTTEKKKLTVSGS
jgi:hypothetical protein